MGPVMRMDQATQTDPILNDETISVQIADKVQKLYEQLQVYHERSKEISSDYSQLEKGCSTDKYVAIYQKCETWNQFFYFWKEEKKRVEGMVSLLNDKNPLYKTIQQIRQDSIVIDEKIAGIGKALSRKRCIKKEAKVTHSFRSFSRGRIQHSPRRDKTKKSSSLTGGVAH